MGGLFCSVAVVGGLNWIFDASGKQLPTAVPRDVAACSFGGAIDRFPVDMRGGTDVSGRTWGLFNAAGVQAAIDSGYLRRPQCAQYTSVGAASLAVVRPTDPQNHLWVGMISPALLSKSMAATRDYLKAADAGAIQQQEDAAKAHTAPKL